MDGAPVGGESIPIRVCLFGYGLTPTMRDIAKKFLVRYFLNLVLVDEEEIFQATGSVQILIFHSVFILSVVLRHRKLIFVSNGCEVKVKLLNFFFRLSNLIFTFGSLLFIYFVKKVLYLEKKVLYFCTCLVSTLMQCFANFLTLLCVKIMLH